MPLTFHITLKLIQIVVKPTGQLGLCCCQIYSDCSYEKKYLVCNLPKKSRLHFVQLHVIQKYIEVAIKFSPHKHSVNHSKCFYRKHINTRDFPVNE